MVIGAPLYLIETIRSGYVIPFETTVNSICITLKVYIALMEHSFLWSFWRFSVALPKMGDLSKCSNYRGISLLSVPGKVFNRVILERVKDTVDSQLRDQQAGFRKNRSCMDQIGTLRNIVQ